MVNERKTAGLGKLNAVENQNNQHQVITSPSRTESIILYCWPMFSHQSSSVNGDEETTKLLYFLFLFFKQRGFIHLISFM